MSPNRLNLLVLTVTLAACTSADPARRKAVPLPGAAPAGSALSAQAAVPFRPGSVQPLEVTFLSPTGPQKTIPGQIVAMFN